AGAAAALGRPRRRGCKLAAVVADFGGEKVGEREEVAGELTEGSIRAEEGRRWELGGEGRSSGRTTMADGGLRLDFGRRRARPSSWRGRVGSGRGCAARSAKDRSGAARFGRRDERQRPARALR